MSVVLLLARLEESNVTIELIGDQLKLNAPAGTLTPDIIIRIKERKKEIIDFLKKLQPQTTYKAIEPAEKKEYYSLSSAQQRLYFLQYMDSGIVYNMWSGAVQLGADIDINKLEQTFGQLIQRHESLRTSFETAVDNPVQKIHENLEFKLEYYEVEGSFEPVSENSPQLTGIIKNFIRPFDLGRAPLLRACLIKSGKHRHRVLMDIHHIIADGLSYQILMKDFMALYSGQELPPLKLQYKDYVQWEINRKQNAELKQQEEYWLKELADEIPVLNLPVDFNRPLIQSFEGSRLEFHLTAEETKALKEIALQQGTTLYSILLAGFTILLSKLSGQDDIIVGTDVAGRSHNDLEGIIGMFVNTLAMRNFPTAEKTINRFLSEVQERAVNAFANQDYQFEDLVQQLAVVRDPGRNPLFDVMLSFQAAPANKKDIKQQEDPDRKIGSNSFEYTTAKFDLLLAGGEIAALLFFSMEYCRKLFKKETIQRFISYFKKILSAVIQHRNRQISTIEIISEIEKKQVLFDFNNTGTPLVNNKSYSQLFEHQVAGNPDKIAAAHHLHHITYNELNVTANRIGHFLVEQGVTGNTFVALYLKRSLRMLASIIGVFKAGAAYLPLEFDYPQSRLKYILEHSDTPVVITGGDNPAELRGIRDSLPLLKEILTLDSRRETGDGLHGCPHRPLRLDSQPDHLAYMIYTSGTTGDPKGVMIHQAGMINHLYAKINDLAIMEEDIIAQTASACFDISVWQFLAALLKGGRTVIIDKEIVLAPREFLYTLQQEKVTILESVPSLMTAFLETASHERDKELQHLRWMIPTGEPLGVSLVREWYRHYPAIKLVNAYGPTEASDDVTHYIVNRIPPKTQTSIPIGKPLQNMHIYILDKHSSLCPVGVRGEICVAGIGVGKGYWKDSPKTRQSFIPNPFLKDIRDNDYAVLYKTGDIGYFKDDGTLECLGRIDNQVKIRGNRIELGEIENRLLKHDHIREAVVLAKEEAETEKYLCAYIVSDNQLEIARLREYLSRALPDYMIPAYFIQIDRLPVTPNGKLDRKALPEPQKSAAVVGGEYAAPRDETEDRLVRIWAEILGIENEKIGIQHNFFELGGDSLGLVKLISKINREFEVQVPITQIYHKPVISEISKILISQNFKNSSFVLLNRATSKKLFCFPPQIGYGIFYIPLAKIINDYSFYAFSFIEDMEPGNRLKKYADIITGIQPQRPYILFGYSAAGPLTLQVAKYLEDHGGEVSDIIFFDCYSPGNKLHLTQEQVEENFRIYYAFIDDVLENMGVTFLKEKVLEKTNKYMDYYENITSLEKVNVNIHLITSEEHRHSTVWDPKGWEPLTAGQLIAYDGFGEHRTLFQSGYLEKNAEIMRKILDKIEQGNRRQTSL